MIPNRPIRKEAELIAENIVGASQVRWESDSHEQDAVRNIEDGLRRWSEHLNAHCDSCGGTGCHADSTGFTGQTCGVCRGSGAAAVQILQSDLHELVQAVFAAGFRLGHDSGSDSAAAYERGYRPTKAQTWEAAWKADVQWMLDTDTSQHVELTKPEDWSKV